MNTIKFGITTYLKSFNIAIKVHIIYIKSIYIIEFYRIFAKKTNMFSFSGFKELLLGVTTLPEVLNSLSEAALLAQIQRYFLAS